MQQLDLFSKPAVSTIHYPSACGPHSRLFPDGVWRVLSGGSFMRNGRIVMKRAVVYLEDGRIADAPTFYRSLKESK